MHRARTRRRTPAAWCAARRRRAAAARAPPAAARRDRRRRRSAPSASRRPPGSLGPGAPRSSSSSSRWRPPCAPRDQRRLPRAGRPLGPALRARAQPPRRRVVRASIPSPTTRSTVDELEVDGDAATGRLAATRGRTPSGEARTATCAGTFTRGAGGWHYAGEDWSHDRGPALRDQGRAGPGGLGSAKITADLPAIYAARHRHARLHAEPGPPDQALRRSPALAANTLLSLPDIQGWNEPGEALKLRYDPEDPYLTAESSPTR